MKGFLVLLVFSAAGLAAVLYWRQSLHAPPAPVVASAPAKAGKTRHRHRRGARRLARNEAFVAPASPDELPSDAPPARGEAPAVRDTGPTYGRGAPADEEKAPLAPGGSSVTEVAGEDLFGEPGPMPKAAPSGGQRLPPEPEPIKLRASDLKIVWQGEDLSKPEVQRLDFSNEGGHELSESEIDAAFRAKEDAILGCIARARPDEYTYVPGRVTVRFRIQRTGTVKGVQVEAPAILHKGGLLGCVRGVLGGLKLPASSTNQVVSYPFSLM
jgi:hypothetical protein